MEKLLLRSDLGEAANKLEMVQISLGSVQKTGSQVNSGLTIVLVLRGSVMLKSPDLNRLLTENQCAVLNHNDFFTLESTSPNVLLWVNMERGWLQAVCPEAADRRYFCCSTVSAPSSEPLYDDLRQGVTRAAMYYFRQETGYWLLLQAELLKVLHTLILHFPEAERHSPSETENKRLAPILTFLRQNYRDLITLETAAQTFFISDAHLSRTFRQELGVTFSEYLTALRLESARQDLIHSQDSITRIALNNGFSSTRSMNQYFQRTFGCTPAQFRKQVQAQPRQRELFWLSANPDGSLETLARFFETYETRLGAGIQVQTVVLPAQGTQLNPPTLLLDVGDWRTTLQEAVRMQLIQAQKSIHFRYIRLSGVFWADSQSWTQFQRFEFLEQFESFLQLGLTPFIRIAPASELPALKSVMELLLGRLGGQELSGWKFELDLTGCSLAQVRMAVQTLRSVLPQIQIGFRLDPAQFPEWAEQEEGRRLLDANTGFVTTCADPNRETAPSDAVTFDHFQRQYFRGVLARLRGWLSEHGQKAPVYLMEWNTLTGHSIVEAGEFHRTALITDTLLNMREETAGFGFRLNLRAQEMWNPVLPSYSMSLYLYHQIKRPLFFVLRGIDVMGSELLWESPGLLVTRRRSGRYIVLLWHPCYIDPFQSLENLRRDQYRQTIRFLLKGLEPGRYRIKRFLVDKENGSTYNSWLKIDLSAHMDQDVMEYLVHSVNPAVTLEERDVEKELEITEHLSLNASSLWSIRKIESR